MLKKVIQLTKNFLFWEKYLEMCIIKKSKILVDLQNTKEVLIKSFYWDTEIVIYSAATGHNTLYS